MKADQVTDTVERLVKNDLDTEQTEDNTIERPVDDCDKEDDYGYDEQSFEEELSLRMERSKSEVNVDCLETQGEQKKVKAEVTKGAGRACEEAIHHM